VLAGVALYAGHLSVARVLQFILFHEQGYCLAVADGLQLGLA